jgi:predicted deacylase
MKQFWSLPILQLSSGDSLSVSVFDFAGKDPEAPSVYFQSALHGSEVQGSLLAAKLVEYFSKHPPLGRVRIVPNCNPLGIIQKRGEYTDGRFDPVRGDNWNRRFFWDDESFPWSDYERAGKKLEQAERDQLFRSMMRATLEKKQQQAGGAAQRIALQLQLLSLDFDRCLDLHCANRSTRHVYVAEFAKEEAKYLAIPFQLIMKKEKFGGSMDEVFFAPWVARQRRRKEDEIPVAGFTLELGNHEEVSAQDVKSDLEGVLNYLRHLGTVKGVARKFSPKQVPLEKYHLVSAPVGGITSFLVAPGKKVKRGQVLAEILVIHGGKIQMVPVKSPINGYVILEHSSAIVHEGAELLKILANPK